MKINEVNRVLKLYEDKGEIDSLSIDGFSGWIKIKNDIFLYATKESIPSSIDKGQFLSLKGLLYYFKACFDLLKILSRVRGRVLLHTALTSISKDKDIYTHNLIENKEDFFYFVNVGSLSNIKKNNEFFNQNITFADNFFLWPIKYVGIKLCSSFLNRAAKSEIDSLCSFFKMHGIDIPPKKIYASFVSYALGYKFYKAVFKILKPSRCYVVSAYSKSEVCAALSYLGVETIEIQHGLIGEQHRGYNYSHKLWSKNVRIPTPSKIQVSSLFWKDELLRAGYYKNDQVFVGANYKLASVDDGYTVGFDYILFTGQGVEYECVRKFVEHSNDYLKANNLVILYKAHPRERLDVAKSILGDCGHLSFYEGAATTETLLYHAKAHVSLYSSCHFDAVELLGKTFVLVNDMSVVMTGYITRYPAQFIEIESF